MSTKTDSATPGDMEHVREAIMLATLPHVPFDGWSVAALDAGARSAGYDHTMVLRAFPRGLGDAAQCWSAWADHQMLAALDKLDLDAMRVRDGIATALKARIMANAEHREALRRCISWLMMPLNLPVGARNTACSVNAMWYAAGDTSSDWNYYTKRGLLAPVYTTAVLYWLDDEGDENGDYPDTWGYVDRRIDDVLKTFGLPKRLKDSVMKSTAGKSA